MSDGAGPPDRRREDGPAARREHAGESGHPRPGGRDDDEVRALLEATDLRDQIAELRQGPLRERRRELLAICLGALALALLGVAYGTPGFAGAGMLLMLGIIPVTRRMAIKDRIRRLHNQLERIENQRLLRVAQGTTDETGPPSHGAPSRDAAEGLGGLDDPRGDEPGSDPRP